MPQDRISPPTEKITEPRHIKSANHKSGYVKHGVTYRVREPFVKRFLVVFMQIWDCFCCFY